MHSDNQYPAPVEHQARDPDTRDKGARLRQSVRGIERCVSHLQKDRVVYHTLKVTIAYGILKVSKIAHRNGNVETRQALPPEMLLQGSVME